MDAGALVIFSARFDAATSCPARTTKFKADFTSFTLPGTTLHYSSISQAARDNSLGKIYEGWHFSKAVIDGEALGMSVGNYVFNHHFQESVD